MKKLLLLGAFLLFSYTLSAQSTKWEFDKSHTKIGFSVTHMMITDVEGQFHDYEGAILSDKNDFSDAKISFNINVKSIDTENEKRDNHLRSADFFDVEKFPQITFVGEKMEKVSKGKYKLTGKFTMLGVTKTITLDVSYKGMRKDPWGNLRAGFKITGTINRNDWGLKYNSPLDGGGFLIGEEVDIICNVELIKSKS